MPARVAAASIRHDSNKDGGDDEDAAATAADDDFDGDGW